MFQTINGYVLGVGIPLEVFWFVIGALTVLILKRSKVSTQMSHSGDYLTAGQRTTLSPSVSFKTGFGQASDISLGSSMSGSIKLIVNGQTRELNSQDSAHFLNIINLGNKIEAIKFLREKTDSDLKDAKDMVDKISSALKL